MEAEMDKIKGRECKLPKRYEHHFKLTYHKDKFYGYEEREDVIEQELQLCDYFAIVTSEKMTASEALNLYKSRDISQRSCLAVIRPSLAIAHSESQAARRLKLRSSFSSLL